MWYVNSPHYAEDLIIDYHHGQPIDPLGEVDGTTLLATTTLAIVIQRVLAIFHNTKDAGAW